MANVQISGDLFYRLVRYHLLDHREPDDEQQIKDMLNAKVDAMARHDLYTKSKTAATADDRETARQRYLDAIGMHKDWRR